MIRPPPKSTLFPSPPLFRSRRAARDGGARGARSAGVPAAPGPPRGERLRPRHAPDDLGGAAPRAPEHRDPGHVEDRKSTRLNSSHANISYAVFCLKKKKNPP